MAVARHIGDAAEPVVGEDLEAGDVVVLDGRTETGKLKVRLADQPMDTRVAGVVSTDPSLWLAGLGTDTPLAVTGQVPVKVVGPVKAGDMLVSSDVAGHAKACTEGPACWGAVVGKATEGFDGERGRVIAIVNLS